MLFPIQFKRPGSDVVSEVTVSGNSLIKTQADAVEYVKLLYPAAEIISTEALVIPEPLPAAAIVDTGPGITPSVAQKSE